MKSFLNRRREERDLIIIFGSGLAVAILFFVSIEIGIIALTSFFLIVLAVFFKKGIKLWKKPEGKKIATICLSFSFLLSLFVIQLAWWKLINETEKIFLFGVSIFAVSILLVFYLLATFSKGNIPNSSKKRKKTNKKEEKRVVLAPLLLPSGSGKTILIFFSVCFVVAISGAIFYLTENVNLSTAQTKYLYANFFAWLTENFEAENLVSILNWDEKIFPETVGKYDVLKEVRFLPISGGINFGSPFEAYLDAWYAHPYGYEGTSGVALWEGSFDIHVYKFENKKTSEEAAKNIQEPLTIYFRNLGDEISLVAEQKKKIEGYPFWIYYDASSGKPRAAVGTTENYVIVILTQIGGFKENEQREAISGILKRMIE